MKKVMKYALCVYMLVFVWLSFCNWAPFRAGGENPDADFPFDPIDNVTCDKTDLWNCISINEDKKTWWEETIIRRLLHVFKIDVDENSEHKFLDYVRAILNIALGLLSMVALIMTIYTFYLMFFTENEAWAKKAKWNLVGIFIALAIIGLSWLIVSFIFWWYQRNWQNNQERIKESSIAMIEYEMDNNLDNQIYLTV